jgi:hypothetical protein
MTLRSLCRTLPLGAVLVCCLTVSAADEKRRAFGPEWKKVDGPIAGEYERSIKVTFLHSPSNVANFQVPLECGDHLWGYEIDDNAGSCVEIRPRSGAPYGGFEVSKNPKGKAESFTVRVGPNLYFDLNADGEFDAMYDHRADTRGPKILFEGKFVPVADSKVVFRGARGETLKVWGVGRGESYEFVNGKWSRAR